MNHQIFTKTILAGALLTVASFNANMAEAARGQVMIKTRMIFSVPKKTSLPAINVGTANTKTVINYPDPQKRNALQVVSDVPFILSGFTQLTQPASPAVAIPGNAFLGTLGAPSLNLVNEYPDNTLSVQYAPNSGVTSGLTLAGFSLYGNPNMPLLLFSPNHLAVVSFDPNIPTTKTGPITLSTNPNATLDFNENQQPSTTTPSNANILPNAGSNKLMGTGVGGDISATYFIADYFAAEGSIGLIYNKYKTTYTINNTKPTGSIRTIPISLTAQFHPFVGHKFSPYLGAGMAYLNVSDPSHSSIIPGGMAKVLQMGVDHITDDGFGFTMEIKKYIMKSNTVTYSSTNNGTVTPGPGTIKINNSPTTFMAGLVFSL